MMRRCAHNKIQKVRTFSFHFERVNKLALKAEILTKMKMSMKPGKKTYLYPGVSNVQNNYY